MAMETTSKSSGIKKYLPILSWLPDYPKAWLRFDLLAGLGTAVVVIPQSMAYAGLAGLPVEVGLYAALTPMLAYVLLGSSRVLSVSVTSTLSVLTATVLTDSLPGGDAAQVLTAAATLALMVGLLLILAGLLKLGFLVNFISDPVLTGFKAGIGLMILTGQIGKALGIAVPKGGFVETALATLQGLNELNWASLLLSLLMIAILALLPRFNRRIPAALVGVAASIVLAAWLNGAGAGIKLVGTIPSGLPTFQLPDLALVNTLLPGAIGIALMSFVESIAAARAFARKGDPIVDADQELLALGAGNVLGGLFQAYPGGGGTSQTAVNRQSGAKSQLAALVTALTVGLTLLVLAPLVGLIPQPALAALVLVAAAGLIKIGEFRAIQRIRRAEFVWALIAFAGVLLLGTLEGILVAVVISLLTLMYAVNHPPIYPLGRKPGEDVFRSLDEHPNDDVFPGLLILRTEGFMHFASMPRISDRLQELIQLANPRVVILECSAIPDIEYTALNKLSYLEERLTQDGIELWLTGLNPVPREIIRSAPLGERLGNERMFSNLNLALAAFLSRFADDA
jgi:high affinity sulfate transporter 1